jgi:sortase A
MDWRWAVRGLGKALIVAGVVVLLFVAYQLWGTGIAEARSQSTLKKNFSAQVATTPTTAAATPGTPPTTAPALPPPPTGEAVAIIRIPKIGVTKAVVEGVGVPDLRKGPGHYPDTPLPGQPGNAAIAGHRTTYGAPFYNLDQLKPGDPIFITTRTGANIEYDVVKTDVVRPDDVSVVAPTTDNRLTLTTCNPRYSAAQRLAVVASLKGPVVEAPTARPAATTPSSGPTTLGPDDSGSSTASSSPDFGLGGQRSARLPALVWGLATFAVGLVAWLIARRRRWYYQAAIYLAASPVMVLVMFTWFQQVNKMLPANI